MQSPRVAAVIHFLRPLRTDNRTAVSHKRHDPKQEHSFLLSANRESFSLWGHPNFRACRPAGLSWGCNGLR